MKNLLLATLLLPFLANGQTPVTIARDTTINEELAIILSNDSIIQPGSVLKCGRGTLPNGCFKYIHTANVTWVALLTTSASNPTTGATPLTQSFGGLNLNVKAIRKTGNKKRGYRYAIKVGGGDIVNYLVELEDAIALGEIIGPNVSPPALAASPVSAATAPDPANRLKKLKALLDQGAITQGKYDSTKKRILDRM